MFHILSIVIFITIIIVYHCCSFGASSIYLSLRICLADWINLKLRLGLEDPPSLRFAADMSIPFFFLFFLHLLSCRHRFGGDGAGCLMLALWFLVLAFVSFAFCVFVFEILTFYGVAV